jgi:hypothetical protein
MIYFIYLPKYEMIIPLSVMISKVKTILLTAICLMTVIPVLNAQPANEQAEVKYAPVISRVAVLSIHIRDTIVHDSIYHFLTEKLGLPVEYYPLTWSARKYAGIFAGNMYLEPCGPYSNFSYASNDFRAIFFGLNCETERPLSSLAEDLAGRNIEISRDETIQVTDPAIIKQNIYFSIASGPGRTELHEDSLRALLYRNTQYSTGIERIKEIRVGYPDRSSLDKWAVLMRPSVLSPDSLWIVNKDQSIRFEKSSIREVSAIVFKVRSVERAKKWLTENNLYGEVYGDDIALDRSRTFGLLILLSGKEN